MDLDLNELTRQGKNICPHCNKPKVMYYAPWCPICEKDDALSTIQVVNIVQVLEFFKAVDGNGVWKEDAWNILVAFLDYPSDDSYEYIDVESILEYEEVLNPRVADVFRRIIDVFELDDEVILKFSW